MSGLASLFIFMDKISSNFVFPKARFLEVILEINVYYIQLIPGNFCVRKNCNFVEKK